MKNPFIPMSFRSTPLLLKIFITVFGILSLQSISADNSAVKPIFTEGKVASGSEIMLGDPDKWGTPVKGLKGQSTGGKITIEPQNFRAKGDAVHAVWSKSKERGEIAIYGPQANLAPLKETSALMFNIKVHQPPTQNVDIGMDCGYPCRAEYDIGNILRAIKPETWTAIPIPLSCFKSSNFDLSKINGMFLMSTAGELDASIANIRIEELPQKSMDCPKAPASAGTSGGLNPDFFYFINGKFIGSRGITLGDPSKWGLSIEGLKGESASGKIEVKPEDFQSKNDALNISWSRDDKKGELIIYGPTINIDAYKDVAALTFDVKVNKKPRQSVKVGMDCGYPCRAEYEVGKTLRKLEDDTWTSFPIPLNCFQANNFDLSKVQGVFLINTSGRMDLSIANIRLEKLPAGAKTCKK